MKPLDGWINCPNCEEVDGAVVPCSRHRRSTRTEAGQIDPRYNAWGLPTASREDIAQQFLDLERRSRR